MVNLGLGQSVDRLWLDAAVGAISSTIIGKMSDFGIDNFIKEVGNPIQIGNSALFLLVIEWRSLFATRYKIKELHYVRLYHGHRNEDAIVNSSTSEPLKLYTIYSPPQHPEGTAHKNKAEALEYEAHHQ